MKRQVLKTGGWGWAAIIIVTGGLLLGGSCSPFLESANQGVSAIWVIVIFKLGHAIRACGATLLVSLLLAELVLRIKPRSKALTNEGKGTVVIASIVVSGLVTQYAIEGLDFTFNWWPYSVQALANTSAFYLLSDPQRETPRE